MKLKTKYILFSIGIHAVFTYLLFELHSLNQTSFLIAEGLVVLSFMLSIWLYKAISSPFDIISSGIESLKDKDFGTKLNKVGHREMDELISVYNLMIDQLREERLKQVEKTSFLEKLIEASPSGIIILDFDGKIDSINPVAAEITGLAIPTAKGMAVTEIPGKLGEELRILNTNQSAVININGIKSYKCHRSTFTDRGFSREFITIDELTREIYIKEKSAFEKVIKIMSHEVNNSIGAINSILNSCLNYKNQLKADDQEDYANALEVSINRNKNLSGLVSNFARVIKVPEPEIKRFDIIPLLRSVQLLLEPEAAKKEVEWIWNVDTPQLEVCADYQQLEQVFINVFKNAIEAVDFGGEICIQTKQNPCSVAILNTGPAIPKEISAKLFSPFFSTKKNGQGIGLMLIREILYNHKFAFSLDSDPRWTSFNINFSKG